MKRNNSSAPRTTISLLASMALLALILCAGLPPSAAQELDQGNGAPPPGQSYASGQLLLRFRPWVSGQRADQILARRGVVRMGRIGAIKVDVLGLPPGLSVEKAVTIFSRHPDVEFAEPNYVLQALQTSGEITGQWGLQKIRAPEAWGEMSDPQPVLLAIVDTGIDRNHSDLAGNIWENPGEVPGDVGFDDDLNGYVDDIWGWDFQNGDNDPMDDMMHGTAVSSVAAGIQDGAGVAGVCPWCKLMSVKVLNALGSGTLDTVAQGIIYAANQGADVINLSLGATEGSQTLEDAVTHAWTMGSLVVAAAGNNGAHERFYPAAYAHSMAVASTDSYDYRSCFSNYFEDFITVAAPGQSILFAMPNQAYGTDSGTSVAAPHVTGLAGLLLSQDPSKTNDEVWSLIEDSAIDLGPEGRDAYYGSGRIDAYRAVTGAISPTVPPPPLSTNEPAPTSYAHARKVARDANGTLHWVWHDQDAGQYQVLYATSNTGGKSWTDPQVVFSSSDKTYNPALAVDGSKVYIAFPSMFESTVYRTFFSSKPLSGGTWPASPPAVLGGEYDAARPDLYVDPSTGKLHLVASSYDNAPSVYYRQSDDGGANWSPVQELGVEFSSRYADVHANADSVTIAVRTLEFWFGVIPRYHLHTFHSDNGGTTWDKSIDLATHMAILTDEYGASLASRGSQWLLSYEHNESVYVRSSDDGWHWTDAQLLGTGRWPSLTQASDGQAWALWDSGGSIVMRHYTGSVWEAVETLGGGSYPNLKLGTSGNRIEWVAGHCSAPYCMTFDWRALGDNQPPVAKDVSDSTAEDTIDTWHPDASDVDGDSLSCTADATSAEGGVVTVESCLSGTYSPAPDFYGTDTFNYKACDPGGLCDIGTVSYNVSPLNDAPVASFHYSCTNLQCSFNASRSYDSDGTVTAYAWDFGDGNTGSGVTPSHEYSSPGTHTVILTVTDNEGATGNDSQAVAVSAPPKLHVGDLEGDSGDFRSKQEWDAVVIVTIHDAGEQPVPQATVHGTWSGGVTGSDSCVTVASGQCQIVKAGIRTRIPSVVFSVDGVTHASLPYEPADNHDLDGDSDGTTITVYMEPPAKQPPVATFIYDCTDLACKFDASGSYDPDGTIVSYAWDLGDSSSASEIRFGHNYAQAGTYVVELTVTDNGGATDTVTQQVPVGLSTMHVGDLDGDSAISNKKFWRASVVITMHDEDHNPVPNATVGGIWTGGASGSGSCITDAFGQCSIQSSQILQSEPHVTFAVDSATHPSYGYAPGSNHDPDGDSLGTSITILGPNSAWRTTGAAFGLPRPALAAMGWLPTALRREACPA